LDPGQHSRGVVKIDRRSRLDGVKGREAIVLLLCIMQYALIVHHILSVAAFPQHAKDLWNGLTLKQTIHIVYHSFAKRNGTQKLPNYKLPETFDLKVFDSGLQIHHLSFIQFLEYLIENKTERDLLGLSEQQVRDVLL
jgi:hypothetical protein